MWITSFGAQDASNSELSINRKRIIIDDCGQERVLHTMESCNFLRLEKENYIHVDCQVEDGVVISVCQEY